MKKTFRHIGSMGLLITAVLAACTNELPTTLEAIQEAGRAISFAPPQVDTPATRGLLVQSEQDFNSSFVVYAYEKNGSAYLDHEVVTKHSPAEGDEQWTYAHVKRWPNGEPLDFYAYTPDNSDYVTLDYASGQKVPQVTYTLPAAVTAQHGLLIADPILNNKGYDDVVFNFHHMNSAVRFKIPAGFTRDITVKSLSLRGIYGTATFQLTNFTQSDTKDPTDYTLNMVPYHDGTGVMWTTSDGDLVLNPGEDTFLVIPQTCPDGAMAEMTVVMDGEEQRLLHPLKGTTWQRGYIYTYTVNMKFPSLILTLESASVNQWEETVEYEGFTADDEVTVGWNSYPLYNTSTDVDNGYVAVAAGEESYTITDEHGTVTTVNTHAPSRSAIFNLTTSSNHDLKLKLDNPKAKLRKYIHDSENHANSHWEETTSQEIIITAGEKILTTFSVVADVESFDASDSREAFLTLEEQSTPAQLLAFITDGKLPKSSDHTQLRFRLLTPAEWDSKANITEITKE